MAFRKKDNKNLLLNQIDWSEQPRVRELVPLLSNQDDDIKLLSFSDNVSDNIIWSSLKGTGSIIITPQQNGDITLDVSIDAFAGTGMYFSDGQIGIGRIPLHEYKIDVEVPVDTQMTALHIGDGTYGFSLGNATNQGFLPQIIGLGSDADDAGLYFLGKVSSSEGSNIPGLIFDARDINNEPIVNRPIMGITSGSYSEYKMLLDASGNLKVNGEVTVKTLYYEDASGIIKELKKEIEELKNRLLVLENVDSSI